MPSRNDGPVDTDIGALKGKKGYKEKDMDSKAKETAKVSKERKEKE